MDKTCYSDATFDKAANFTRRLCQQATSALGSFAVSLSYRIAVRCRIERFLARELSQLGENRVRKKRTVDDRHERLTGSSIKTAPLFRTLYTCNASSAAAPVPYFDISLFRTRFLRFNSRFDPFDVTQPPSLRWSVSLLRVCF